MFNLSDPVTDWVVYILASVVMGTSLLIAVAFIRRWQQNRYSFYLHTLQRIYRPRVAKLLAGTRSPAAIETLRRLPMADLENLMDPLFSRRKLSERQLIFLQALCSELGLIKLWQSRVLRDDEGDSHPPAEGMQENSTDHAIRHYLLRAKSIRNLGKLRHHASWPLLVNALDDRHLDIQLVALRSLGAVGAPESFGVLRERLHAALLQRPTSAPVAGLRAAMASFEIGCAPALFPSLSHLNHEIRLHAIEILRTIIAREAARWPDSVLSSKLVTPRIVELVFAGLAIDASAEIRAGAAEVIVYLADPRITPVMSMLLRDAQWLVRHHSLRALARCAQAAVPLQTEIRDRLDDGDWRVREAAIQALIALGPEGMDLLYEHFLTSSNFAAKGSMRKSVFGLK